jgi:MFS family permease
VQIEDRPAAVPPPVDPPLPIADLIGQGLIERCYGAVYDPAGIQVRETTAEVIDLRDQESHAGRRELRTRWGAFRLYWLGHLLSMIGDHLTLVALPLAADRLTHSGLVVGMVVSAETVATVLFGTAAGTMTDRRHPAPTMVTADLLRAGVLALIAVLDWRHAGTAALIVTAAFALGLLRLLHDGAESSMIARLVPDELDVRSNARLTLSENVGMTLGPLLAGAMTTVGLWLAFGADSVTFLFAAIAVALVVRAGRRRHGDLLADVEDQAPREPFKAEFRRSFSVIWAHRRYRQALLVMALINIAALPLGAQFVTLARHQLHLSVFMIGVMFAIGGAAGIVAAPIVERSTSIRPAAMLWGGAGLSAGVLLVGFSPSIVTIVVAFVIAGFGLAAAMTHYAAMRQRIFPATQQGRVALTSRMILWSILPVGAIVGGWLSDAVDPAAMWIACGVVGLAATAWGWLVGLGRVRFR